MYAKVFAQIFDSSIAEDYNTRHVFMDLLVLADCEGVIDMTLEAISRRTNVPQDRVESAIKILSNPDSKSRTKSEDGKRLIPIDPSREWGWIIVNYDHYRLMRDEEGRRSYHRTYMRQHRAKSHPVKGVNICEHSVKPVNTGDAPLTHAEAEAEALLPKSVKKMATQKGLQSEHFQKFWKVYPLSKGSRDGAAAEWEMGGCDALVEVIMDGLEKHRAQKGWREHQGRYIPTPEKWIREKRWEYKLNLEAEKSKIWVSGQS